MYRHDDLTDDEMRELVRQADIPAEERPPLPEEFSMGSNDDFIWHVFNRRVQALLMANGIPINTVAAHGLSMKGNELTYERRLLDTDGHPVTRIYGSDADGPLREVVTRTTTVTVQR